MATTDDDASPTLRRLELSAALHALRSQAGMTLEQVSTAIQEQFADSFSQAKLSKIENGQQIPLPRDVAELATVYDVAREERERLIQLARDAKKRGWWQEYSKVGSGYRMYADVESAASSMRNYESTFVPGLLQTPEYAKFVIYSLTNSEYAPGALAVRMKRQQRLTGPNPLRLHVVIQENALWRTIGDVQVMLDQIEHLQRMAELDNVTIQIIRFNAGLYAALQVASFAILDFPKPSVYPTVVYTEGIFWNHFVEAQEQKDLLAEAFAEMCDTVALSPQATKEQLVEIHDRRQREAERR